MKRIITSELIKTVSHIRQQFVEGKIDRALLEKLYIRYNQIPNTKAFINKALKIFPSLNCGVASVYLKHMLQNGTIVNGSFAENNHTFLLLESKTATIIDITADQYGGPKIYIGKLAKPWAY